MAGRAAASADQSPRAFDAAHRALLDDGSIQFELQRFQQEPPRSLNWLGRFLQSIFPVLEILFWVGLAVLVSFLLYVIVKRLSGASWRPRGRSKSVEDALELRPSERVARQLLAEADALAGAGRYSEASHLLLFRGIEDIDCRRPHLLRPALTSRDIASLHEIPPAPRAAFGRLVVTVERSLFGGHTLDSGDWRDCRAAYTEFAFADGWRG